MNGAFAVHMLNEIGKGKARNIAEAFDILLVKLEADCPPGRELAITKTKLEEACFFARKAMAADPENQVPGEKINPGMTLEQVAKRMFDAYNTQGPNPGKTWDGKDVPPWENLGEQVQAKWIAAASAFVLSR
jgi:hypothetical protein